MSSTPLEKLAHKQWEEAYLESSSDFDSVRRTVYRILHRKRLPIYAAVGMGSNNNASSPTIVITSSVSIIVATAFTCTFTFNKNVVGFHLGNIIVNNGTASNFIGSGRIYTAIITPITTGVVTIDVMEGICADATDYNNVNMAAAQFSILAIMDIVAYWKMNEESGVRVDSTGHGNDLAPHNAGVSFSSGLVGNSAKFETVSEVTPEDGKALQCTSAMLNSVFSDADHSVVFWFRPRYPMTNTTLWWGLFQKAIYTDDEYNTSFGMSYREYDPDPQKIGIVAAIESGPTSEFLYTGATLSRNEWHFVIYKYDATTRTVSVSIDNKTPTTLTLQSIVCSPDNAPLIAGAYLDNFGGVEYFYAADIDMDEVLILNRLITADESNYLWNNGAGRTLFP